MNRKAKVITVIDFLPKNCNGNMNRLMNYITYLQVEIHLKKLSQAYSGQKFDSIHHLLLYDIIIVI